MDPHFHFYVLAWPQRYRLLLHFCYRACWYDTLLNSSFLIYHVFLFICLILIASGSKVNPKPVHVGFVVNDVPLKQAVRLVLTFHSVSFTVAVFPTHSSVYHGLYTFLANESLVKKTRFGTILTGRHLWSGTLPTSATSVGRAAVSPWWLFCLAVTKLVNLIAR